jgi:hypothetical protein
MTQPFHLDPDLPVFDPGDCTLRSCPLVEAGFIYIPSLAPNAIYLSVFLVLLIVHTFHSIRYRTWAISGAMFSGLIFEIIGYHARIRMHTHPTEKNALILWVYTHLKAN